MIPLSSIIRMLLKVKLFSKENLSVNASANDFLWSWIWESSAKLKITLPCPSLPARVGKEIRVPNHIFENQGQNFRVLFLNGSNRIFCNSSTGTCSLGIHCDQLFNSFKMNKPTESKMKKKLCFHKTALQSFNEVLWPA